MANTFYIQIDPDMTEVHTDQKPITQPNCQTSNLVSELNVKVFDGLTTSADPEWEPNKANT